MAIIAQLLETGFTLEVHDYMENKMHISFVYEIPVADYMLMSISYG